MPQAQEAAVPEDWEACEGGAAQAAQGAPAWAPGAQGGARECSEATRRSLAVVDESVLNFDLLEALVAHIVAAEAAHGPDAMLQVEHMALIWRSVSDGSPCQSNLLAKPACVTPVCFRARALFIIATQSDLCNLSQVREQAGRCHGSGWPQLWPPTRSCPCQCALTT